MSRKWTKAIEKLLGALRDEASAADLVGRMYDHAVAQPVSTYVDGERLLGQLDRLLAEANVERWVREHLGPYLQRDHARAKARGDLVGDWLTAEAQAELRSLAARPVELDRRFLEKLVQQGAVKHMLKSVVEETIGNFIETLRPGGSGAGEGGRVARSAFGFAKQVAGGGILGAIGGQVEQQISRAARTFIDGSMTVMLERLVAILASPETARQLGRSKLSAYDEAMKTPTAKLTKHTTTVALDDLAEVLPGVVAHNLARPEIRAGILEEVEAALAVEGDKTVAELLGDDGAALRAEVVEIAAPLLASFAEGETFLEWLATTQ